MNELIPGLVLLNLDFLVIIFGARKFIDDLKKSLHFETVDVTSLGPSLMEYFVIYPSLFLNKFASVI
jgi:hypothetical protein